MRCSNLIPIAVIVASATASVVPNGIFRRQDGCASTFATTQQQISACGSDFTCSCGTPIDQQVQQLAQACDLEQDPDLLSQVQDYLSNWSQNCIDAADGAASSAATQTVDSTSISDSTSTVDGAANTSTLVETTGVATTSPSPILTTSVAVATSAAIQASPSHTTSTASSANHVQAFGTGIFASIFAVAVALF